LLSWIANTTQWFRTSSWLPGDQGEAAQKSKWMFISLQMLREHHPPSSTSTAISNVLLSWIANTTHHSVGPDIIMAPWIDKCLAIQDSKMIYYPLIYFIAKCFYYHG
jgi:hypothetical protein